MILDISEFVNSEDRAILKDQKLTINTELINICPDIIPFDTQELTSLDNMIEENYEITRDLFAPKARNQTIDKNGIVFIKKVSQSFDSANNQFQITLNIGKMLNKKKVLYTCNIPLFIIAQMALNAYLNKNMSQSLNAFYNCIMSQLYEYACPFTINATQENEINDYYLALCTEQPPNMSFYCETDYYFTQIKTAMRFKANEYAVNMFKQSGGKDPYLFLKLKLDNNIYNTIHLARDRYGYIVKTDSARQSIKGYLGLRFLSYNEPYIIVALESCRLVKNMPIFIWNNVLLSFIRNGVNCPISTENLEKQLIEYDTQNDNAEDIF